MINKNEQNDAFEQHMEQTVNQFMDHYAQELSQQLEENAQNVPYPRKLDKRCRKLIRRSTAKEHWFTFTGSPRSILRPVAVAAVAVLLITGALLIPADAFRSPTKNYVIQEMDGYWRFDWEPDATVYPHSLEEMGDPLAGLLPEEYKLVKLDNPNPDYIIVRYENEHGQAVRLITHNNTGISDVGTKFADKVAYCTVDGFDGLLVERYGYTHIYWVNGNTSQHFSLISDGIKYEELFAIAEKISENSPK